MMHVIGGKVWHISSPDSSRPSDIDTWVKRAERRAANGYVVTSDIEGHPVERICPYCRVEVVVIGKPKKGDL